MTKVNWTVSVRVKDLALMTPPQIVSFSSQSLETCGLSTLVQKTAAAYVAQLRVAPF